MAAPGGLQPPYIPVVLARCASYFQLASPPTRPPSCAPSYMSSLPEVSSEVLWDEAETNPETQDTFIISSATNIPAVHDSVNSSAQSSSSSLESSALLCLEETLELEDWSHEAQADPDPQQIPEEARLLMEARMAAPQGGLDASSASHSWEHPASSLKRKRIFSYEWVQREDGEPPVGMSLI